MLDKIINILLCFLAFVGYLAEIMIENIWPISKFHKWLKGAI